MDQARERCVELINEARQHARDGKLDIMMELKEIVLFQHRQLLPEFVPAILEFQVDLSPSCVTQRVGLCLALLG